MAIALPSAFEPSLQPQRTLELLRVSAESGPSLDRYLDASSFADSSMGSSRAGWRYWRGPAIEIRRRSATRSTSGCSRPQLAVMSCSTCDV